MRSTTSLERLRNGVHPACVGLSRIFNYVAAMWEETLNPPGGGSFVAARERGIRLYPSEEVTDGTAMTQMIRTFQPEQGKLLIVAARLRNDHLPSMDFRFGVSGALQNGVYFVSEHGAPAPWVYGRIVDDSGSERTDGLFALSDHFFFNLAIVFHGTGMVDFVWERSYLVSNEGVSEGTWGSATWTSHVPTRPLRPFFFCQRVSNLNFGHLDVRGFVVREKTLRE